MVEKRKIKTKKDGTEQFSGVVVLAFKHLLHVKECEMSDSPNPIKNTASSDPFGVLRE